MKKLSMIITATIMSCLLCLPALVYAQESGDTTNNETVQNARQNALDKRKNKQTRLTEIKNEVAARKLEVKQSVCEKRESRINAMIPRLSRNANTIKGVIDKKYERSQEFYESEQLTTPDYDTLVAEIELAKANSEASLDTLADYEVEIDCENEQAGEQLDAFRTAANDTKDDLKEYRKTVVALISALKSANANENREDTDSDAENETDETEEQE